MLPRCCLGIADEMELSRNRAGLWSADAGSTKEARAVAAVVQQNVDSGSASTHWIDAGVVAALKICNKTIYWTGNETAVALTARASTVDWKVGDTQGIHHSIMTGRSVSIIIRAFVAAEGRWYTPDWNCTSCYIVTTIIITMMMEVIIIIIRIIFWSSWSYHMMKDMLRKDSRINNESDARS